MDYVLQLLLSIVLTPKNVLKVIQNVIFQFLKDVQTNKNLFVVCQGHPSVISVVLDILRCPGDAKRLFGRTQLLEHLDKFCIPLIVRNFGSERIFLYAVADQHRHGEVDVSVGDTLADERKAVGLPDRKSALEIGIRIQKKAKRKCGIGAHSGTLSALWRT